MKNFRKITFLIVVGVLSHLMVFGIDFEGERTNSSTFQQGNYTITAIHEVKEEGYKIAVFPNPTSDVINVKINIVPKKGMTISIYNINGKVMSQASGEDDQAELTLDLSSVATGNYLLKVVDNKGNHLQTFQVVKH